MGVMKAAAGDGILTAMFVFTMPMLRLVTAQTALFLGVESIPFAPLFLTSVFVTIIVLTFSIIGAALGGASFNPASTVAFYAAGLKPDASLLSLAVRFPAQAVGGAIGVLGILRLLPEEHRATLRGPALKVDLHTGAIAEGLLTFVLSFLLLFVMVHGPRNFVVKIYLVAVATVAMVIAGSEFTGPSMNPANAFGWAYVNNWHNSWDLFYVYWICPLVGALFAALAFKLLLPPPLIKKQKKA